MKGFLSVLTANVALYAYLTPAAPAQNSDANDSSLSAKGIQSPDHANGESAGQSIKVHWLAKKELGFKILAAGNEKYLELPGPVAGGKIKVFSWGVPDRGLCVGITDEQKKSRTEAQINTGLDAACRGAVGGSGGTELSRKAIKLQGCLGREVIVSLPKGLELKQWMFLHDSQLYSVTATGSHEWINSPEIIQFFDSFTLL